MAPSLCSDSVRRCGAGVYPRCKCFNQLSFSIDFHIQLILFIFVFLVPLVFRSNLFSPATSSPTTTELQAVAALKFLRGCGTGAAGVLVGGDVAGSWEGRDAKPRRTLARVFSRQPSKALHHDLADMPHVRLHRDFSQVRDPRP